QHADRFVPSLEHAEDIAYRGARRRRHYADRTRHSRQQTFALDREQSVSRQALFQLLESELLRARAHRLHMLDYELIFAARVVNRKPASRDHVQAIFWYEPNHPILHPETRAANRCGVILEREIPMP